MILKSLPLLFLLCTTFKIQAQCVSDPVSSLVVNGDFSKGNKSFTSGYSYCNSTNCLFPEGYYAVGKNANSFHSNFVGRDHTNTTGNFMIVNGAGVPNTIVWSQTITVKANTDYNFSSWVMSLVSGSPARLQFQINGVTIGSIFSAPSTVNNWQNFFVTWNSGTNTNAVITILNQNTTLSGNDFGLDDISFIEICNTPVPELGGSKTLCGVGVITLNTNIPHNSTTSVTWSDGITGTGLSAPYTHNVNAPGKYWVCVKDGPCVKTDTVTVIANFSIDLGPDFTLCAVSSFLLDASYSNATTTYKWYKNNVLVTDSTKKTFLVRSPGTYKVEVYDGTCGTTKTDEVLVNSVSATPNDGFYCPPGDAVLSVTPNPTGAFKWYDKLSGGTMVGKGNTIKYKSTKGTVTMYAEDTSSFTYHVGPLAKFAQGFAEKVSSGIYIQFNAKESFTLNSVQVFANIYNPNEVVQVGIALRDNLGNLIASKVQSLTGPPIVPIGNVWPFTVPLNFAVPIGNGLRLTNEGTPASQDLFYASGTSNVVNWSSYKVAGVIELTGLDPGHTFSSCLTTCYGFFYDWQVSKGNNCARVPVMSVPNCALPVEFLAFNAEPLAEYNLIQWQVARQENVAYYNVQRSLDGKKFETIIVLPSSKNQGPQSFIYQDKEVNHSLLYYRIEEVDVNGEKNFTDIANVKRSTFEFSMQPNPTSGILKMEISTLSEKEENTITVYNSLGEFILSKTFDSTEMDLNLSYYPSGVYYVGMRNSEGYKTKKLVKY